MTTDEPKKKTMRLALLLLVITESEKLIDFGGVCNLDVLRSMWKEGNDKQFCRKKRR